ncbi:MAG: class I SAM-dependent methyltransferase [Saprospiraceae bacterium]|nr:class I SAM-dependent methyltransferase [Saprospiraceae bacterium]
MNNPRTFWDKRYADSVYAYGTKPNLYFQQQLDVLPKPGRLLLLAEGEGRNAVYAAEKSWQVTAVDFSEKGREKALALAAEKGVSFDYQIANIREYDLIGNGPWDVIGLIYAHFPPELRKAIHHKCIQALKPGGRVILEAFNRKQIYRLSGGPKELDMLYSKIILEHDFEGLEILEATESTTFLTEGEGHAGLAEVVRFLLKKST